MTYYYQYNNCKHDQNVCFKPDLNLLTLEVEAYNFFRIYIDSKHEQLENNGYMEGRCRKS